MEDPISDSTDFLSRAEIGLPRKNRSRHSPFLIQIMGSKGGAGASFVTSSIALFLTTMGRRVLHMDTDPRGPTAQCFVSSSFDDAPELKRPSSSTIQNPKAYTPIQGLHLQYLNILRSDFNQVFETLTQSEDYSGYDFVIVDAGSTPNLSNLALWNTSDLNLLVISPEPTSVLNSYRLIHALNEQNESSVEQEPLNSSSFSAAPVQFHFMINHARLRNDLELGYQLQSTTWRKFNQRIEYLGYMDHDKTILDCARKLKPLIFETPGSGPGKSLERITRRLLLLSSGKTPNTYSWSSPRGSFHDLLEVDRGSTDDEIRKSYKRMKETFNKESLCCFGIYTSHEINSLRQDIERGYELLMDPTRRKAYELQFFPTLPSESIAPPSQATHEHIDPPAIDSDTCITGGLLKQLRQSQSLSLKEISHQTKIRSKYLEALEEENYSYLPAMVFVKGFVFEFSKIVGINPHQASRTYVERMQKQQTVEKK